MEKLHNIGANQRLTRRYSGYILLIAAAVTSYWYINAEISTWWLVAVFALTQLGVGLVLEARSGICAVNAVQGKQSMKGWFSIGQEDFEHKKLLPQVKQVSLTHQMNAVLIAFVVTTLTMLAA